MRIARRTRRCRRAGMGRPPKPVAIGRRAFRSSAGDARPPSIGWFTPIGGSRRGRQDKIRPSPVTDWCGYNQSAAARRGCPRHARPLAFLRVVEQFGDGLLVLRARDGCQRFEARIDPDCQRYQVRQNDWPVPTGHGRLPADSRAPSWRFPLVDRQFLLAMDGRKLADGLFERRPGPRRRPAKRLPLAPRGWARAGRSAGVPRRVLHRCRSRLPGGTFYTGIGCEVPAGRRDLREHRLGADEYFVVGDNSPISEDSRTWHVGGKYPRAGLPAAALVGKPFAILFAASPARRGGSFQVPDTDRIRYIR